MSHPDTNLEDLLIAVKRQDRAAFDRLLADLLSQLRKKGEMPSDKLPATRKPKWLMDLKHWIYMEGNKRSINPKEMVHITVEQLRELM